MTQDQYGQARGSGHVVDDDVVPENETEGGSPHRGKPAPGKPAPGKPSR